MPTPPSFADVQAAAERIRGHAHRTPVLTSRRVDAETGARVYFKCENFQRMGAFKFRGAFNALSRFDEDQRRAGVVTYSSGNHAQAIALAAGILGIPATIVMPHDAPEAKVAATLGYGASVVRYDRYTEDREEIGRAFAADKGLTLVPPYDHPDVIAGQGTIGLEICADLPDVATILVPVSGGGLISGVATAVKSLRPNVRVIGVEPELAADAAASLHEGKLVRWDAHDRARTIADGLRAEPSELTFAHIREYVDDIVTVTEDEIRAAVGEIARRTRVVSEPSGAVPVAAYLNRSLPAGPTVAVVSGGNIEPKLFAELVSG
jgi:threonine dehydratase